MRQLVNLSDTDIGVGVQFSNHAIPIDGRETPATSKKIDKERLNKLDSVTLVELIKDYMRENQELRKENADIFAVRWDTENYIFLGFESGTYKVVIPP